MRLFMAMTALLLAVMISGPLHGADFYKGKKIRLIVSSSPGGGNDTYSRLIARHISRHIPGNPSVIVQNMPGAGGIMAADYLYRKAKRDGTVLEQINWGVWFHQVVGSKRARFDFNKINAVGVAAIESAILFTRKAEFPDWKSVLASKKLITSGNSGRQSLGYTMGKVMEVIEGRKIFDYVFGYPGARQYSLAFRQGEVQSSGNTPGSFADQLGDMWDEGKVAMLAQATDARRRQDQRIPQYAHVVGIRQDRRAPRGDKGRLRSHPLRPSVCASPWCAQGPCPDHARCLRRDHEGPEVPGRGQEDQANYHSVHGRTTPATLEERPQRVPREPGPSLRRYSANSSAGPGSGEQRRRERSSRRLCRSGLGQVLLTG